MIRPPAIPRAPRPSRITAAFASRVGPPVIDPQLVTDVLGEYGAMWEGRPANLRLARRSLNVIVETAAGRRVLKRYRPQWQAPTVRYGHSILEHLAACDVPAVRVLPTASGSTYVERDAGVFAVFDFVDGVNYSLNFLRRRDRLELTVIAAQTLARLHRNGEGYVPDGAHHLGFVSLTGPRRRDLDWHLATIDDLEQRSASLDDPDARALGATLRQRSAALRRELEVLDRELHDADLPRLVIHGDYGLHNLLFQRGEGSLLAVPVDFEVSRLDWRMNDLVSALGKYRYRGGHYDLHSMHTFMDAYAGSLPLTRDEVRLLAPIWRFHKLQAAVQYWRSYFETEGPVRKLESAVDALDQAQSVVDRPGVVAQIGAALRASASRPVTVLQVTPNLEIGGAQENLRTMARYLPAAGCRTVVCTFDDGPLRSDIERLGVPVEVLPGRRHRAVVVPLFALEMRRRRRQMLELIASYGVDVVQTRGLGTLDFLVASLALARPWYRRFSRHAPLSHRVKVWWTIENTRFMVRAEHLGRYERWMLGTKRAAHRVMYRAGARLVEGIIVVSDETETSFRESVRYRGHKLHVVENAADLERFDAKTCGDGVRPELGLDADQHVMTMVGTFKQQKGHTFLIAALREVAAAHPDLQVLLVGDGELLPSVQREAAAAGLTCVHFLGARRDVDRLLAASDSFVLPSLWEGLPVALVEAAAAGLPVVATDVSGSRKVVVPGRTGWLVPPGDARALAAAIDALLTDPRRAARMGEAGRRRAQERFSAAGQAEQLAALFGAEPRRTHGRTEGLGTAAR